jgi:hypothetical protein
MTIFFALVALLFTFFGLSLLLFTDKLIIWGEKVYLSFWESLGYKEGDAPWITAKPWPFSLRVTRWFVRIPAAIMVLTGIALLVLIIMASCGLH